MPPIKTSAAGIPKGNVENLKASTPNLQLKVPKAESTTLARVFDKLKKEIPKKYRKILNPSAINTLTKALSRSEKEKIEELKKNLKSELEFFRNLVARICYSYWADSDVRKTGEACLNSIEKYCKKVNIKLPPPKVTYHDLGLAIKNIYSDFVKYLESFTKAANILYSLMSKLSVLEKVRKVKADLDQKLAKAKSLGINTENYSELVNNLGAIMSWRENSLPPKEIDNYKLGESMKDYTSKFKELVERCNKGDDWGEIEKEFYKLLQDLKKSNVELQELMKKVKPVKIPLTPEKIGKIGEQVRTALKELDSKIEFSNKLAGYKVFDNNMGLDIKFSYLKEEEQKKKIEEIWNQAWVAGGKANPKFFKHGSQDCLSIAQGKKRLEQQYDHKNGDSIVSVSKGPYYILVDKDAKQVQTGNKTINKSSKEQEAITEVENYLKAALQAGSFNVKV